MTIGVVDFGVGNLHSLTKALARHGSSVRIVDDASAIEAVDAIVLPGVGAFGAAARSLEAYRGSLTAALGRGLPCLGICLGMQLLFDASEEGHGSGLGVIPGRVRRLRADRLPQMGWNDVEASADPLFAGIVDLVAYYANSFVVTPDREADVIAWSDYGGDRFPAAVRAGTIWGVQFHPEKSGTDGLRLVDNFMDQVQ